MLRGSRLSHRFTKRVTAGGGQYVLPHDQHTRSKTIKATKKEKKMAELAALAKAGERFMPDCMPPRALIAVMAAAGAEREECKGENMRAVRIPGIDSEAWRLYKEWACSMGVVYPLVLAAYAPTDQIEDAGLCLPPSTNAVMLMCEANSIVKHMAPLLANDILKDGIPVLPDPLDYMSHNVNFYDAQVATTTLIEVICDPGPKYPVINELETGKYISHVQYLWRGAWIMVPVFRS